MIVGVPRETCPGERPVALASAVSPRLTPAGCEVLVEAGAGEAALYPDAFYVEKDARMATERAAVFAAADVLVQVRAPSTACRSSTWTRPAP